MNLTTDLLVPPLDPATSAGSWVHQDKGVNLIMVTELEIRRVNQHTLA